MLKTIRFWAALGVLLLAVGCTVLRHLRMEEAAAVPPHPVMQETESTALPAGTELPETSPAAVPSVTEMPSAAETADASEPACTQLPAMQDSAASPYLSAGKLAEIEGRLEQLEELDDLVGWLYMADSEIDYPVMQGTDNQFYLKHAPDGSAKYCGSVFLDSKCQKDLSDRQNILYGHNLQKGMFGDLRSFRDPAEFEAHRYAWLITGEQIYRIEFLALAVVSAYDPFYALPAEDDVWQETAAQRSVVSTGEDISPDDHCIALSTCAGDFSDARALLIGRLTALTDEEAVSQ